MSADRLTEAARVLRERAEACDPRQGDNDHDSWADVYRTDAGNGTDAALIRVMHPGVALALADWLDELWGWREEGVGLIPDGNLGDAWVGMQREGIRVADLILGEGE